MKCEVVKRLDLYGKYHHIRCNYLFIYLHSTVTVQHVAIHSLRTLHTAVAILAIDTDVGLTLLGCSSRYNQISNCYTSICKNTTVEKYY